MKIVCRIALWLVALFIPLSSLAQPFQTPKKIQIADGIYLFLSQKYGDVGLDGNSIAILSSDGVIVFDSNGTPAVAAAVLAEIRKMTDQPVKYLINSHWHWDHWYGAEVYKQAFPDIRIVTHQKTREMMMGPAIEFNRQFIEKDLPGYVQSIEKRVATMEAANPPSPDLPKLKKLLEADSFFLKQKAGVHHTVANLTFESELNIYLGERHVQVLHYDRAVTPGDSFLYLPKEKILITGDLLVNPVSFALGCYPTGWLQTLEKMNVIDADTIVPGHGEPLHDKELLRANIEVMREMLRQGKESKQKGLSPDQAIPAILSSLESQMQKITRGDAETVQQFKIYLVDWYVHRVYDELEGPLSDAIKPPPRH